MSDLQLIGYELLTMTKKIKSQQFRKGGIATHFAYP